MLPIYYCPICFPIPHYNGLRIVDTVQDYCMSFSPNRQFPEIDPTLFEQSAKSMQVLMKEASLVLNKLAQSKDFASKVMYAAQQSNMNEVNKLIKSTGIKSKVKTSFNPDGIHLNLSSSIGGAECCQLTVSLRWL
ncbi:hypothetical protein [Metabacillus halosaccharovorans]|uniref:hypothetical protein n=1 Tax=Metabacillus halosaccharovorans TaxID=930124 RepID=UPI001FEC6690|nr:hypothetical protein [Metabacillus halosaccharovorans]